jgi:ATP-dependent protease HslVU (ClpYQ) ATPase subunit
LRKKADKEHSSKKVRSAAARKRAKFRTQENEMSEFNKEAKLSKKLKQGKITQKEYDTEIEKMYKRIEYQ